MNDFEIRPLQIQDFSKVYAIEKEQLFPWSQDNFLSCFQEGYKNYVVIFEKQIIGFVLLKNNSDDCELMNIAIARSHRQKGYGEKLLQYILKQAIETKKSKIFLEVRESNLPAQALYKKMGFKKISVRKEYYSAGAKREDAVVMVKLFDED